MAKGRVFLMEFIFISPRLMSLRHKDEAFLHIPFPIPYILRSNSSEPALLLRLSLLLVEREGTKKKRTGDLNIYFMSVCPFDTHLWHHASQFSFRLCSSIVCMYMQNTVKRRRDERRQHSTLSSQRQACSISLNKTD